MKRNSIIPAILLLSLLCACSDKEARETINGLSEEIQMLKSSISELRAANKKYSEAEFKLEGFRYQFLQEGFNPVLSGHVVVSAVNKERLPSLARVEIVYKISTSKGELLSSGVEPVTLTNGQGRMNLNVLIPAMISNTDDVKIQLFPHRWFPIYLANPSS